MKNRILAAMALCCATSSTMPLWAAEYGDPTIVTVEPNLATDGTGGGSITSIMWLPGSLLQPVMLPARN